MNSKNALCKFILVFLTLLGALLVVGRPLLANIRCGGKYGPCPCAVNPCPDGHTCKNVSKSGRICQLTNVTCETGMCPEGYACLKEGCTKIYDICGEDCQGCCHVYKGCTACDNVDCPQCRSQTSETCAELGLPTECDGSNTQYCQDYQEPCACDCSNSVAYANKTKIVECEGPSPSPSPEVECPCEGEECQLSCPEESHCPEGMPTDCPSEGGNYCTETTVTCEDGCGTKNVTVAQIGQCDPKCIPEWDSCPATNPCPSDIPKECPPQGGEYCIEKVIPCADKHKCLEPRQITTHQIEVCGSSPTPSPSPGVSPSPSPGISPSPSPDIRPSPSPCISVTCAHLAKENPALVKSKIEANQCCHDAIQPNGCKEAQWSLCPTDTPPSADDRTMPLLIE